MKHFFPTIEKVNSLDSEQQCVNVLRVLCTTAPKGIHWREDRSWMKIEGIDWPRPGDGEQDVVVTGVVRGKPLQSDRLVCLGDWGDFQIRKITDAPRGRLAKSPAESKRVDLHGDGFTLEEPTADQDDLLELAPEQIVMDDDTSDVFSSHSAKKGVLIDDTYYYPHDTEAEEVRKPKKLPRGTSSYQAAWYLGDYSDSGSDLEDVEEDDESMGVDEGAQNSADGFADAEMRDPTEAGPSEYPQSEAFLDPSPQDEEDDIEAYRQQRQKAAAEDLEFPDEIELNPKVLARERLARYRGLKDVFPSLGLTFWTRYRANFHARGSGVQLSGNSRSGTALLVRSERRPRLVEKGPEMPPSEYPSVGGVSGPFSTRRGGRHRGVPAAEAKGSCRRSGISGRNRTEPQGPRS